MMDCAILYNAPAAYSECENLYVKEPNNKNNHDEDLIEGSAEEIFQSWKPYSNRRDLPSYSASFGDPFDEVAATCNRMQGVNHSSAKRTNLTDTDIITPATRSITDEDAIDPIEDIKEIDFEVLAESLLKEEHIWLVPPSCQSQQTYKSQVENEAKAQVDHNKTEEDSSLPTKGPNRGHWDDHEHNLFVLGIERYGRQWRVISNLIKTRTPTQVRTHAQKYFSKNPNIKERSILKGHMETRPMKRRKVGGVELDYSLSCKRHGRWLNTEHDMFLQGMEMFGRDWKMVATLVKTRTVLQIRTHAQKYFQKLGNSSETAAT